MNGHEWEAIIKNRNNGSGCYVCYLSNKGQKNNKPIKQINKETEKVIKIFKSAVEAEKETGINRSNISNACKDNKKTSGGFKWKFV